MKLTPFALSKQFKYLHGIHHLNRISLHTNSHCIEKLSLTTANIPNHHTPTRPGKTPPKHKLPLRGEKTEKRQTSNTQHSVLTAKRKNIHCSQLAHWDSYTSSKSASDPTSDMSSLSMRRCLTAVEVICGVVIGPGVCTSLKLPADTSDTVTRVKKLSFFSVWYSNTGGFLWRGREQA